MNFRAAPDIFKTPDFFGGMRRFGTPSASIYPSTTMKFLAIICALAFTPALLRGETKTFVGEKGKLFTDPANWDTNSLPEKGDHVQVTTLSEIPMDTQLVEMDSLEAVKSPCCIYGGEFLVHNAIQAYTITVGQYAKRFEWGGEFGLATSNPKGGVSLVIWANSSTDSITRCFGGDLTFTTTGELGFIFYRTIPKGLPDNDEPILALKGKLNFLDDSVVVIGGKEMDMDLPSGNYLLVKAKNISTMPQLKLSGFPSHPGAKLKIEGGKLILTVP